MGKGTIDVGSEESNVRASYPDMFDSSHIKQLNPGSRALSCDLRGFRGGDIYLIGGKKPVIGAVCNRSTGVYGEQARGLCEAGSTQEFWERVSGASPDVNQGVSQATIKCFEVAELESILSTCA